MDLSILERKPIILSPGDLDTEFREYESAHFGHKVKMIESWDFYMSRQWPANIAAELIARGQFPLVINKVYPIIQSMLSYLTAERPSYSYLPVQKEYVGLVDIHEKVGRWVWDVSNGNSHLTRCVQEMLVGGLGWMQVFVDPRTRTPRIKRVPAIDVFPDPASEDVLTKDASSTYIRKIATRRAVIRLFPEREADIQKAPTSTRPVYSNSFKYQSQSSSQLMATGLLTASGDLYRRDDMAIQEDMICLLERYARVTTTSFRMTHRPSGKEYLLRPEQVGDFVSQIQIPTDFNTEPVFDTTIRQTTHIMNANSPFLQDIEYPMEDSCLIPFMDNHMDNPMPEGEVEHLKGLSMERNKRRSLLIHHATTSSNSKWLVQDGATAPGEFENKSSQPGAVLYWRKGYQEPRPIFPLPLPEVLHYLETQSDKDLQDVSGMFSMFNGDPHQAPNSWHGILQLDEYGGRRPALKQRQIDDALSQLGQVVLNFCQLYMTSEQVLRVVGKDGRTENLLLNSKDPTTGEMYNSIGDGDWICTVKGASTLPSNRMAKLQQALEMKREGIYDDIAVLKYMDDPEADEVIQRKSLLSQVAGQNDQLAQSNQEMTGQLKNLQQTITALQQELAKEKSTKEIDAKLAATKATLDAILVVAKRESSLQAKEARMMLQRLQRESALAGRENAMAEQEAGMEMERTAQEMGRQMSQNLPGQGPMQGQTQSEQT